MLPGCLHTKEGTMSTGDGDARSMAQSATLPPLMARTTLHWDGTGAVYRDVGPQQSVACDTRSLSQTQWQPATIRQAQPLVTRSSLCLLPSPPPQTIDCHREAACLTFYLDPSLLLTTVCAMLLREQRGSGAHVFVAFAYDAPARPLWRHLHVARREPSPGRPSGACHATTTVAVVAD